MQLLSGTGHVLDAAGFHVNNSYCEALVGSREVMGGLLLVSGAEEKPIVWLVFGAAPLDAVATPGPSAH
jgi:hypothetical protein